MGETADSKNDSHVEEMPENARPARDPEQTCEQTRADEVGKAQRSSQPERQPQSEVSEELEALRAAHQRLAADFENYKRHATRQGDEARQLGRDRLLRSMAPVLGELDSATRSPGEDAESLRKGMLMIRQKLDQLFAEMDYQRIETVGKPLDPEVHEAVAVVAAPDPAKRGLIVEEISPGYKRGKILVQPARVIVAR
jgi:molecular chaperone GrpE